MEWIIALETQTKVSLSEEDMMQHGESSGKDKDERESEQEEQYNEGHQDPPKGDEKNKESEMTETDQVVVEKRKAHAEAAIRRRRKIIQGT